MKRSERLLILTLALVLLVCLNAQNITRTQATPPPIQLSSLPSTSALHTPTRTSASITKLSSAPTTDRTIRTGAVTIFNATAEIAAWNRLVYEKMTAEAGDCSEFVPETEKRWFLTHAPPNPRLNLSITIPMQHLHTCLNDEEYDRSSPPFELEASSTIFYSFALNELLELTFDGKFVVRASFVFMWNDYRLVYQHDVHFHVSDEKGGTLVGSNGWAFPDHGEIPATEIWVPSFYLENCMTSDCAVRPTNETLAYVHENGTVQLHLEAKLEASCELSMQNFPFDDQNCRLLFVFQKMHRGSQVHLVPMNETMLPYMHDHDEWRVTSVNHSSERLLDYKLVQTPAVGKWARTRVPLPLQSFNVSLWLSRHPEFYVYNIIVPLCVIMIADWLTVLVPFDTEGKIELAVSVLLAFIFLLGLVSDMSPRRRTCRCSPTTSSTRWCSRR